MAKEIIDKISFNDSSSDHSFEYDVSSGFLKDQHGAYLLFRAEGQGKTPSARSSGDLNADQTLSYGPGLYTGNSPEAVAPYTWVRPDNVINAYVTPPLRDEEIFNHEARSQIRAAKEFYSMSKQRKRLGWQAVSEMLDESRGGVQLATLDAGVDIHLGQTLLSSTTHAIKPRWGIWRGSLEELTHIGIARASSKPYVWATKLAGKPQKK